MMNTAMMIGGALFIILGIGQFIYARKRHSVSQTFTEESIKYFTWINLIGITLLGAALFIQGMFPSLAGPAIGVLEITDVTLVCLGIQVLNYKDAESSEAACATLVQQSI